MTVPLSAPWLRGDWKGLYKGSPLGKRTGELVAESGMRDADQRLRPLAQGFSLEIDPAVFGDDDVGVVAGSRDRPLEPGDDPRDGPLLGRGMAGDDGLAAS